MSLSGDETCLLCAGKALVKAEDFPDAARVLTQYLVRDSGSVDAVEMRAYANFKLGRKADAMSDYERAAQLRDADSEYKLGVWYVLGENGFPKDRAGGCVGWLSPPR